MVAVYTLQILRKENFLRILCKFYIKILIFVTFWPFLNTLHKKLTFYQIMSVNKKGFTINKTKYKTQFHCIHNSNWWLQNF